MTRITLKAARVNAGYDQKTAAKKLKVSNSTLGKWERGESFPNVDKAQEMCTLYGLSYNDILFLSKDSLKANYAEQ